MTDTSESPGRAEPAITVEYRLTQAEHTAFVRWNFKQLPVLRWVLFSLVLELATGTVLIAAGITPVVGYVVLGAALLQLAVFGWSIGTAPRRVWAKRRADLAGVQVLTFTDGGVHAKTANTDSMTKWALYERTVELDGLYALGLSGNRAYRIVPRRAFSSSEDEQEFRLLVTQHTTATLAAPQVIV